MTIARIVFVSIAVVSLLLLVDCSGAEQAASPQQTMPTATSTAAPAFTPTEPLPTETRVPPTNTPTPTSTPRATATPAPQILGRIFPEGYDSQGIASCANIGARDSRDTHFDVALPVGFPAGEGAELYVISPVSGEIVEHYVVPSVGAGECLVIRPDLPILGIDDMVNEYGYDASRIRDPRIQICHIVPIVTSGHVEMGQDIGRVADMMNDMGMWANFVSYVLRIRVPGAEPQFSPCDLPNPPGFCDIGCYQGSIERGVQCDYP